MIPCSKNPSFLGFGIPQTIHSNNPPYQPTSMNNTLKEAAHDALSASAIKGMRNLAQKHMALGAKPRQIQHDVEAYLKRVQKMHETYEEAFDSAASKRKKSLTDAVKKHIACQELESMLGKLIGSAIMETRKEEPKPSEEKKDEAPKEGEETPSAAAA